MNALNFPTNWTRAWSEQKSGVSGTFRKTPEDFVVGEELGFEPQGEGEHLYLEIEKIGQNTHWVIDQMAQQFAVERHLFGHSGIKDRHAITTQWISVQDPRRRIHPDRIDIPGVRVLKTGYHPTKLRPGTHAANRFSIRLRDLVQPIQDIENVLRKINAEGFPNYFGSQRFGIDGNNLAKGWELIQARRLGRHKKKAIYLSALRSFLFNQVLHARLVAKEVEASAGFDLTGPLWGRGRLPVSAEQQAFELESLSDWQPLCDALEHSGLQQERRQLWIKPESLVWTWETEDQLLLEFALPPGCYATSLIQELGDMVDLSKTGQESR